jgi:curved DNA-binding protein CbpA
MPNSLKGAPIGGIPAAGDLAALPPLHLYYRLAAEGLTGRLALTSGSCGYEVFFKKGAPEAVRPSCAGEDLGSFLVERGGLSPAAVENARRVASGNGGDVVAGLFMLKLINPAQAFTAIGEHAVGLLRRALALRTGTFVFQSGAPFPNTAMPLGDRWALVCDAVRALPALEIKARLGERFDQPIMKSGGRVELSQLRLTPQEARAAATFDGVRSVAALIASMPGDADALARVALLMASFEMVAFSREAAKAGPAAGAAAPESAVHRRASAPAAGVGGEGPERARAISAGSERTEGTPATLPKARPPEPRGPARAPEAPPRPAPSPSSASRPAAAPAGKPTQAGTRPAPQGAAPARPPSAVSKPSPAASSEPAPEMVAAAHDLAKLRALRAELKSRNHFEVLGVPQEALGAQVKLAYFGLAKLYHPDTVLAGSPPELGPLKAEIFATIAEAYRVLGDDKARAAYLEELEAGGGKQEQVDAAAIFAAEEVFQKGCILVKARKYGEGLQMLDEAVRLNDKEGEFWAWRGWAGFLAAKDKAMARAAALKDIDLGTKLNPKCAQAYYFGGQILKLTGEPAGALKWFKKALQVDPKHIDAQREVRMAGGR